MFSSEGINPCFTALGGTVTATSTQYDKNNENMGKKGLIGLPLKKRCYCNHSPAVKDIDFYFLQGFSFGYCFIILKYVYHDKPLRWIIRRYLVLDLKKRCFCNLPQFDLPVQYH